MFKIKFECLCPNKYLMGFSYASLAIRDKHANLVL